MRQTILFCSLTLALAASTVTAQPPAETCGAGDSLSAVDTMPQDISLAVSTDDFDMSGTGCNEQGADNVTCFVPTTDCVVTAECYDVIALAGLQVSINAVQGACSTAPASCLDSSQGTGASGQIMVALTGGTNYCFVCEASSTIDLGLTMSTAGDCGALPVGLQTFEIEE